MRTRLQKWRNSLALRISQPLAKEGRFEENSAVDVTLRNGKLIIAPVRDREFTLEELVPQITTENLHGEVDPGMRRGNEVW